MRARAKTNKLVIAPDLVEAETQAGGENMQVRIRADHTAVTVQIEGALCVEHSAGDKLAFSMTGPQARDFIDALAQLKRFAKAVRA
jgi:hypothetical protein